MQAKTTTVAEMLRARMTALLAAATLYSSRMKTLLTALRTRAS
jgi:hypothetical protein